jgi:hypothetical protein
MNPSVRSPNPRPRDNRVPNRNGTGAILARWIAVITVCTAAMLLMTGPLAARTPGPAHLNATMLEQLIADHGPAAPTLFAIRLAAIAAIGYLVALTTVAALAQLCGMQRTVARLRRRHPHLIRRALGPALVLTTAVALLPTSVTPANAAAPRTSRATTVLQPSTAPPPIATIEIVDVSESSDVGETSNAVETTDVVAELPDLASAELVELADDTPSDSTTSPRRPGTHVVKAGESFWTIAEDSVFSTSSSPPTEREIARYWRTLIDANAHRLRVPGDPDLIFPGQEFVLPARLVGLTDVADGSVLVPAEGFAAMPGR